ncbi:hypothetical protein, partial [Candidatus Schmidhempelia bombi]|uniref:hypothetical protein n=1 Tax=Candidatus Schmidhempelia bombi TaxID=1505866 RepID=UPI000562ABE9
TAGNQQGIPITGWVNLKQAHIKQISPWHWHGFNTIEEKATLGELSDKISKNKVTTLDLADYTPAMRELHHILTGTLRYSMQRKKTTQPSFTDGDLKEGLRTSWTAQQIGHLLINYESEWYADEELSKWNEIDNLYEQEKQQKKEIIEQELNKLGLTLPYQRDFALKKLNEAHEHIKTNWQLEKEKRIKPSLWWKEVAEAQTANSNQPPVNANTQILSNLSMDGKAWFIHPVAVLDYFNTKPADIVTYHIYHDGRIEKHIPQEILEDYEQKYRYVYHDKGKQKHELGIFTVHVTKAMARGNKPQNYDVELIDIREFEQGYSSPDGIVKAKFKTLNSESNRWFINPDCFAGLLGAMLELNVDYLGFRGFSTHDAKSIQSKSHINGIAGDLRYISTKRNGEVTWLSYSTFDFEEQTKFNVALYKFGWGRTTLMYSEYFTYKKQANTLLKHTKHMKKKGPGGYDHYHHLHICGFDFNRIINKKENS